MSVVMSFKQQAQRFAGRGARNMLAAAGLGLLAATVAVAPGYAQQQATPISATSAKTQISINGTQVTIHGNYGPVTAGPNTNCATFWRQYDRDMCMIGKGEALKLQGKQLDAQGRQLDAQGRAAEQNLAAKKKEGQCLDIIVKDIERNGEKTARLTAMPPPERACQIARDLKLIAG